MSSSGDRHVLRCLVRAEDEWTQSGSCAGNKAENAVTKLFRYIITSVHNSLMATYNHLAIRYLSDYSKPFKSCGIQCMALLISV